VTLGGLGGIADWTTDLEDVEREIRTCAPPS
jgi:hypothetical protein